MEWAHGVERWTNRLTENRLSRRSLLQRAVVLGATTPVLAGLLAACDEATDDDDALDSPAEDDSEEPAATDDTEDVEDDTEPTDDDTEDTLDDDDSDDTDAAESDGDGQYGGSLNVALIGDPPSIDIHQTTAVTVGFFTWHIYEPLFTWDGEFAVTPELVDTHEVSDDGLLNTLRLRENVMFHNGEEMTSRDVVASIERWNEAGGVGASLLEAIDSIDEVDDYTIEFNMNTPFGAFSTMLARRYGGCAIYPESVIEESTMSDLADYIGTGPYQLVEYAPDQHVHVQRFDDYNSREEDASGYAGIKHQYLDEIYFIPVPNEASRAAGLQAGDYDYLESLSPDQFEELEDDPNVTAEILPPVTWPTFVFNTAQGVLADQTMRQALQAALNHEELMTAGYGEGRFRLTPSVLLEETAFATYAGEENYNINDPDRARELLDEAGYDGEPIRFITSQEYQFLYNMAAVGTQQLEDVGVNVDLQVYDWATLIETRGDEGAWDIFTTFISFAPDPLVSTFIATTSWPGWWDTDEKVELVAQIEQETDFEIRFEAWEQLQELFYEQVPMIKLGDDMDFNARSPRLQGFEPVTQLGVAFWNMWVED
jgi:peptide/nickel transport system substrate-binding protein